MILSLIALSAASAEPILTAITLHQPEDGRLHTHDLSQPTLELPLGEWLAGTAVEVDYDTDRADRVTVELRYETSVSVSMEGPHWDLDFAHHTSPWLPAAGADGLITLPLLSSDDHTRFPPVTTAQLNAAIRDRMGPAHAGYDSPTCQTPWSEPCFVGISTIWLRIGAWQDGGLVESRVVEITVPMGC